MGAAGPQPRRARPVRAVQPDALLGQAGGCRGVLEPPHDQVRHRGVWGRAPAELPGLPCPGERGEWGGRWAGKAAGRPLLVSGAVGRAGGRGAQRAGVGEELPLPLCAAPRRAPLVLLPRLLLPGTARAAGQGLVAVVVSRAWHVWSLAVIKGFSQDAGGMLKRKKFFGLGWCVWSSGSRVAALVSF